MVLFGAVMVALYVLLDGFTWAGAIHLFVARTTKSGEQVLASIDRCGMG